MRNGPLKNSGISRGRKRHFEVYRLRFQTSDVLRPLNDLRRVNARYLRRGLRRPLRGHLDGSNRRLLNGSLYDRLLVKWGATRHDLFGSSLAHSRSCRGCPIELYWWTRDYLRGSLLRGSLCLCFSLGFRFLFPSESINLFRSPFDFIGLGDTHKTSILQDGIRNSFRNLVKDLTNVIDVLPKTLFWRHLGEHEFNALLRLIFRELQNIVELAPSNLKDFLRPLIKKVLAHISMALQLDLLDFRSPRGRI
jgi:hypothetical protein